MDWLGLVLSLVKLLGAFTQWLHDRQMIDAGKAETMTTELKGQADAIKKAVEARNAARDANEHGRLRDDDGFRRD